MQLISVAFAHGTTLPAEFTCKGSGLFPPLHIENALPGTQSLALIMHDPDAPSGDFAHWLVWNIDPSVNDLHASDNLPVDSRQGTNDFGLIGYGAPCPQQGVHHYVFDLYALNIRLDHVPEGAKRATLERAMQKHVISRTQLVGTVSA